jgi:hypothetical protein
MKNKYAHGAGKGDRPRPVNGQAYRKNFDLIFRKSVSKPQRHIFGKWPTLK